MHTYNKDLVTVVVARCISYASKVCSHCNWCCCCLLLYGRQHMGIRLNSARGPARPVPKIMTFVFPVFTLNPFFSMAFLLTVPRWYFFCGSFVLFMFCVCVLINIWTKGEVGTAWNGFKPSSKISLLTVPRRCFFCGSFMLFLSCFCYTLVRLCLLMPCGHLLGKGWPLGFRLWCLIVKLSLSHWYPGSGVVLDCINSWSLPFFLLLCKSRLKSEWAAAIPQVSNDFLLNFLPHFHIGEVNLQKVHIKPIILNSYM